jgi:O-antigen ligase
MFDAPARERTEPAVVAAGLLALALYTLGVENPHSTALRQIGLYGALVSALGLALMKPARVIEIGRQPLAWAIGALALFAALSAAVSPLPGYSAWEAYKEVGFLAFSAFATAVIVQRGVDARLLLWAAVGAAVLISAHDVIQYLRELSLPDRWPSDNIHKHRYYADPLLWYMPAVLWVVSIAHRRALPWLVVALVFYWLLLAGTGSRAAWYGAIGAAFVWFAARGEWRRGLLAVLALALAIAIALWLLPAEIFSQRATRGLDTSYRVEGTWKPAITLILERPWLGWGYGQSIFHAAYNAQVDANPTWHFRQSLGPHNVFLAVWFAGGVPLIASLVAALGCFVAIVLRVMRGGDACTPWRDPVVAALCSIIGYMIVRGTFETVGYRVAGLAFGVALAAAIACRRANGQR